MTLVEQYVNIGYQEGRLEGRQEGEQIGMQKERFDMARRLKAKGMAVTEITALTGLSEEEVH